MSASDRNCDCERLLYSCKIDRAAQIIAGVFIGLGFGVVIGAVIRAAIG